MLRRLHQLVACDSKPLRVFSPPTAASHRRSHRHHRCCRQRPDRRRRVKSKDIHELYCILVVLSSFQSALRHAIVAASPFCPFARRAPAATVPYNCACRPCTSCHVPVPSHACGGAGNSARSRSDPVGTWPHSVQPRVYLGGAAARVAYHADPHAGHPLECPAKVPRC
jgi:hypothetical protein